MNIAQNISDVAKNKGTTLTEIERACGFSKSSMRKWSENIPSIDKIIKVADYLGVEVDKLIRTPDNYKKIKMKLNSPLLTDEQKEILNVFDTLSTKDKIKVVERAETLAELAAEKEASEKAAKESDAIQLTDSEMICIPFFDTSVSAGTGIDIDYSVSENIKIDSIYSQADFAVRVSGDSMEPRYQSGDIVLVKSTPVVGIGEVGIFILNGQSYIKELGERELISLNDNYENIPIGENDSLYCQGQVIGILNVEKKYN